MENQKTAGETAKPVRGGDASNKEFGAMLVEFQGIVKLGGDKGKTKVPALIEKARRSVQMTFRQMDAIIARCKYFLSGEYGHSKRAEHFTHSGLLTERKKEDKK